jgi:hypothetical protein
MSLTPSVPKKMLKIFKNLDASRRNLLQRYIKI